ncbi:FG-GAP-like repeat-containing protein [Streptomyces sp. NPDC056361]|uniref:FG-GAP-like repeat-containing protein n=1 Tax=Streptomyces sp. NPDC056361 TaxID=3345795 RepID=UPI0035DB3732
MGIPAAVVLPGTASAAVAVAASSDPVADGSKSEEEYALEQAAATGRPYELQSVRTESSDTWALPDGTWSVKRHGTPVRMLRAGAWVPTDPTLVFTADGSVTPKASSVAVTFSGGGTGPLLSGVKDGRTLTLTWPKALPKPTLAENVATYAEVLPGVDLQLKAEVEGFSQLLVVKTAQAAQNPELETLKFGLDTVGVTVAKDPETGSINAVDPAGQTVFTSPTPLMWDSTSSAGGTVASFASRAVATADAVETAPGDLFEPAPGAQDAQMPTTVTGDTLEIKPDQALLDGADTQYPVYIDPSFAWGSRQNWTRVYQKYPNTSFWNTKEVVRVGYENETNGLSRSFFQLDTAGIRGTQVKSSVFRIRNTWSWSCGARPVELWHVGPISSKTTWNRQPAKIGTAPVATVNDAKGWSSDCAAGNLEFDATAIAREAASKGWASVNLGLYASDESDTFGWKKFDAKTAVLETKFNNPPKAPTGLGTSPRTGCAGGAIGNTRVSLYALHDDPDAGNLTAEYQVFKAGNSTPVVNQSIPATRGKVATLAVPDATLPTGDYTWKTRTKDQDGSYSAWSVTCKFTVDRTRPSKPPVVVSTVFPDGKAGWPANTAKAGTLGSFTFKPNGITDVRKYYYYTDWEPDVRDVPVTTDDPKTPEIESEATVWLTPPGSGPHWVYVYSADASGNISDTEPYLFYANRRTERDGPNDLNGDGFNDLWSLDANNALLTYAGQGKGQFSAAANGGKSLADSQITFRGDWDEDGRNDLVSLEYNANAKRKMLWTYPNNGRGVIENRRTELTVTCPVRDDDQGCSREDDRWTGDDHWYNAEQVIAPGDINGDAKPDLLVKQAKHLWAYFGNRATHDLDLGGERAPVLVGGGDWDQFTVIAPGDVNGDSFPDLWLRHNTTGDVYRALGKEGPDGNVDPTTWGAAGERVKIGTGLKAVDYPVLGSSGDLDGDGLSDLWARKSDNAVVGIPGRAPAADGTALGAEFTIGRTLPTGTPGGTPGKPDMSGDTYADMIVLDTAGTLSIRKKHPTGPYFDTGTQVSWGWDQFRGKTGQGKLYFADIDGDGTKDLISHGTDGNIIVRRNDGTGTGFDTGTLMSAQWSNFLGQPGQGRLYFADVTGDGKADMMVHTTDGTISVRKNMGTYFDGGTVMTANWSNFLGQPGQGRLYFADITGDGKADLVVHPTDGLVSVRKNMGTYFDGGTPASAYWSNFLDGPDQGRLYFE